MKKPIPEKVQPRVVEAALTATAAMPGADVSTSKRVEAAMVRECELCAEEGIVDPDIILERKLAVRERIRAEIRDEREAARLAAEAGEDPPTKEKD